MENKLKLTIGGLDATQLLQSISWGGDMRQCARTLDFSLLSAPEDKTLPVVPCGMGSGVTLSCGGVLLLDGFSFSRGSDTGTSQVDIGCVDRGLYLKRNEAHYKFKGDTPEAIARRVCTDFGIDIGALAQTGVAIKRNFPGVSLYKMIQSAYTLAAVQTGAAYAMRFRGAKLEVITKARGADTLVLTPGSNLLTTTMSESVENMVNRVAIYDDNDVQVGVQSDADAIGLYGLFQSCLKRTKDTDATAQAKALLADSGVDQKITVTYLGEHMIMAGDCVVMREPATGLHGLFWVDTDTHTWKSGLHQTKLVLNFRNLMDEQEAGSLPKA